MESEIIYGDSPMVHTQKVEDISKEIKARKVKARKFYANAKINVKNQELYHKILGDDESDEEADEE